MSSSSSAAVDESSTLAEIARLREEARDHRERASALRRGRDAGASQSRREGARAAAARAEEEADPSGWVAAAVAATGSDRAEDPPSLFRRPLVLSPSDGQVPAADDEGDRLEQPSVGAWDAGAAWPVVTHEIARGAREGEDDGESFEAAAAGMLARMQHGAL